jgi:hypothetical protein
MRVAFLFCGRVTGHKDCYESFIQHIVQPLNIEYDSFLAHNSENSDTDIDLFISRYNVKSFVNELPDIQQFHTIPRDLSTWGVNGFKMFYYWKRSYELMEDYSKTHNVHYDIVIYMRADEIFQSDIKLLPIEKNTVYIPEGYDWMGGLNDQMAIGDLDTIKRFMNVYSDIHRIYSDTHVLFHPESYVRLFTTMCRFKVMRFKLDYCLHKDRRE